MYLIRCLYPFKVIVYRSLIFYLNLFITGVHHRLDLQNFIRRVVPSRVEMVATNCPPCEKCNGVADVLCVACDLLACIDCITRIHAVSHNIIWYRGAFMRYLNWVKTKVVFMQEIEGGTNHSTLPCPRTSGS